MAGHFREEAFHGAEHFGMRCVRVACEITIFAGTRRVGSLCFYLYGFLSFCHLAFSARPFLPRVEGRVLNHGWRVWCRKTKKRAEFMALLDLFGVEWCVRGWEI